MFCSSKQSVFILFIMKIVRVNWNRLGSRDYFKEFDRMSQRTNFRKSSGGTNSQKTTVRTVGVWQRSLIQVRVDLIFIMVPLGEQKQMEEAQTYKTSCRYVTIVVDRVFGYVWSPVILFGRQTHPCLQHMQASSLVFVLWYEGVTAASVVTWIWL